MFKFSKVSAIMLLCVSLFGCKGGTSSSLSSSSSSVVKESSFTNKIVATLEEGVDYIDHANTFDGKDFTYDESMWYINNLDKVPLPDPQVFVEDGTYYIVGTSDRSGCRVVDCYYTMDFVNFESVFGIFNPKSYSGWENSNPLVYAPEMYCFDGVYYLYYSAMDSKNVRHNSVVKADNPLGPYEPIVTDTVDGLKAPLFKENTTVLDSTIFVDDDGSMYMYYSGVRNGQYIAGVKLNSPYEADYSTQRDLVIAGALSTTNQELKLEWERYRGGPIVEAPYMIKSNGKYYLTYSANGCWNKYYNVCYAVSDEPLGDFEKPYTEGQIWTNLIMGYSGTNDEESLVYNQWSGFASGTGHHCFFNIGDQIMIGYHAHQNRNNNLGFVPRYFAMEPLYFDEEGVPYCNGPTYSLQPLPEAMNGYRNIALDAKVRTQNVTNEKAINDNYNVDCYNLIQEEGKEVVLGKDYSYIELTFDKEYEIGGIAIYNSAFYDKAVLDIKYIDFMNGNAIEYPEFCYNYFNYEYEFIHPNSAFTFEFKKEIKSNKVVVCIDADEEVHLNEIVVLGK